MKQLPIPIQIDIYRAQMEAIEALQAGAQQEAVRLNMGRLRRAIRKACRLPGQWHRALESLRLLKSEAKVMMKAADIHDHNIRHRITSISGGMLHEIG